MSGENVTGKIDAKVQAREQGGTVTNDGSQRFTTDPAGNLTEPKSWTPTASDVTLEDPNSEKFRKDRSQLSVLKFPDNLGQGVPYVLFKIFETQTGAVPVTDETTQSIRSGASVIGDVIAGIPGGQAAAGAAVGGQIAGLPAALFGAAATTETGQDAINTTANNIFGSQAFGGGSFTSRAKELVSQFALKRNLEQLSVAIALFMPDGITTNYDNEYEALSVTATLGAAGFAAQALSAKKGIVTDINPYIAEAAATLTSKLLGNEDFAKLGLFASTGLVNNPQLEMIYSSPVLRKFTFDFKLIPRNANESAMIYTIVNRLKYYSAPEIKGGTGGRFLIPPAQFEIEFYDGQDNQNQYLFKTKKCVLSGISIDYSPNGFATFRDGAPVETRMQLTFQETVIIDKQAVIEGY